MKRHSILQMFWKYCFHFDKSELTDRSTYPGAKCQANKGQRGGGREKSEGRCMNFQGIRMTMRLDKQYNRQGTTRRIWRREEERNLVKRERDILGRRSQLTGNISSERAFLQPIAWKFFQQCFNSQEISVSRYLPRFPSAFSSCRIVNRAPF